MSARRLLPLFGLAVACAPKSAPPVDAGAAPVANFRMVEQGTLLGALPLTRYEYDNGLQLIVVEDHTAPVATFHTWYGVGSALEEEGKTGLAHLFEHMMFKATQDYPQGYFDNTLEALGTSGLNAWTWLDETVYIQSVPVEALDTVAQLESTRMTRLIVDADALDSEREVVINERRLRVDNNPGGKLNEQLYATAFDQHTYGWPTIGWMADLEGLTPEDCVDFYKTWYAPNNATIVVVGDVSPVSTAATVLKYQGQLPASTLPDRVPPVEPPQTAKKRVEVEIPTTADRIQVGFKAVAASSDDLPAVYVIDAILSSGRSSRLRRALVDTGLASEVSTFALGMADPGLVEIDITAREGVTAEQLEEALFAELAALAADGPTEADLERGIRQVQAATMGGFTGVEGKAEMVGWYWRTTGDWKRGQTVLEQVAQVTADDITRVAKTIFVPQVATVAVGRASQADPDAPAPELRPRPPSAEAAPIAARDVAPQPTDLARGDLVERTVHGGTLLAVHDPTEPLLRLFLAFKNGAAEDVEPGTANLAAQMLLRGTTTRDRGAFEEALERLGGSIDADVSADTVILDATVPADAWPGFVALLTEAMTAPAFDQAALDELKEEVGNQIRERADDDRALASRAFAAAWYGPDHPYGRSVLGTPASLAGIDAADTRGHAQRWFRSSDAVVGLAGAFDSQALADLEGLLGAIQGQTPEPAPIAAAAAPTGRRVVIVDKPERTQVQVMLGHAGVDPQSATYPAVVLGTDVVSGRSFRAWLTQQVRVERGWSYYAYGMNQPLEHDATWRAVLAPGTEYATDAVKLVLDVMGQGRGDLPTEEVEQARNARVRSAPFLRDTTPKRLELAARKALTGYDAAAIDEAVGAVPEADAEAALAALYDPEHALIVMVATAADVQEAAAELGEVTVIPFTKVQ